MGFVYGLFGGVQGVMQGLLSEVNFGRVVWSFTGCIWEVFNGSLGVYVGLIWGLLAGCLVYSAFGGLFGGCRLIHTCVVCGFI